MEMHLGRPDTTDPLELDHGTAERLLRGDIAADDAPPSYRQVTTMLTALNADATATELSGEGKAVDAISRRIAAAASSTNTRSTKMTMKRRLQLVGVTAIGGVTLLSGLGVAGALPGAAQGVASDMLSHVGVSAPNPNEHSDGNADQRGRSAAHTDATSDNAGATVHDAGKGSSVSAAATDPSTTGLDKGAAVSSEASDGKSQAGQHDASDASPAAPAETAPVGTPPVDTPPVDTPPVPAPPVTGGREGTPPVSVPPVSTPPVSTPPVSTPAVSTPPVSIPDHR
jgi:hypothetical protein